MDNKEVVRSDGRKGGPLLLWKRRWFYLCDLKQLTILVCSSDVGKKIFGASHVSTVKRDGLINTCRGTDFVSLKR